MKKRLMAIALVAVLMLSLVSIQASAAAEMKIFRLATAPEQDGKIGAGEYYLLADASNYTFTYDDNEEGDAAAAEKKIYAGYDDNYLYIAGTITCDTHINEWVFVSDGGENDYDIFDGHCAKIAVTQVNPATDADCIATLTNDAWNWSEAFKSVIGRQFTIAMTSDTGIQLSGVHFSHTSIYVPESDVFTDPITQQTIRYNAANDANLPMSTEFFAVSHDNSAKVDVYEVKLPWGWIDYKTDKKGNKGDTIVPVERGDGTYCGLSMNMASGDIDGDVYGNSGLAWANFGGDNQIYFGQYVPLYLAGAADGSATASSEVGSGVSGGGSTAGTTTKAADTGDTTTKAADAADTTTKGDAADTTTKKADSTTTKKADTEKTTTTTEKSGDSDSNTGLIIGIIIGAVVLVAAIVVVIIVVSKKKKAAPAASDKKDEENK